MNISCFHGHWQNNFYWPQWDGMYLSGVIFWFMCFCHWFIEYLLPQQLLTFSYSRTSITEIPLWVFFVTVNMICSRKKPINIYLKNQPYQISSYHWKILLQCFSSSVLSHKNQNFRGTWGFREQETKVLINCGLMKTLLGQMFSHSHEHCKNFKWDLTFLGKMKSGRKNVYKGEKDSVTRKHIMGLYMHQQSDLQRYWEQATTSSSFSTITFRNIFIYWKLETGKGLR